MFIRVDFEGDGRSIVNFSYEEMDDRNGIFYMLRVEWRSLV